VEACERMKGLHEVRQRNPRQRYSGEPGEASARRKAVGRPGQDTVLRSPAGVTVVTDEGEVVGELLRPGDRVMVARGGPGGCKETQWVGLRGQTRSVKLDLKLIADVGFVGFPNAGKSTLLRALSRARPKIASYPFTTVQPNLGTVEYPDLRTITLADLPGLIEGASYNVGMGHKFLKHVERCRLLLFVVDVNGFQFKVDSPHRSAVETVELLCRELQLYKSELITKPAVLALTKMDSKGSDRLLKTFNEGLEELKAKADSEVYPLCIFDEVIPISAKHSRPTVEVVRDRVRHWLDLHHAQQQHQAGLHSVHQQLRQAQLSETAL